MSQREPAQRDLGGLVITPGQGQDISVVQMRTAGGCPKEADAYYAVMRGKGFPADGQIIVATTDVGLSHTAGFDVFLAQTLRDFAADNNTTLQGGYDISVRCIDSFSQVSHGEFTAKLTFGTPNKYAAVGAAKGPDRVPDKPVATVPEVPVAPPPPAGVPRQPAQPSTVPSASAGQQLPMADVKPAEKDSGLVPLLILVGFAAALAAVIVASAVLRRRAKAGGSTDA